MIYFIQEKREGLIKIGFSDDPWKRLSKIQTDTAGEVVMLAILGGAREVEAWLHERFAADNVRGEWFSPSERLMLYINAIGKAKKPERKTSLCSSLCKMGVAKGYASDIANGVRRPSDKLAIRIWRELGVKLGTIATADDADIEVLARIKGVAA